MSRERLLCLVMSLPRLVEVCLSLDVPTDRRATWRLNGQIVTGDKTALVVRAVAEMSQDRKLIWIRLLQRP
ncbi:hypothetical protein QCD60_30175 [Pokkaliibacter sp. MBI-7]|uniref:hypothetical protein n=1 Tax=Pokkaliibacter sp. MBI-7 TaxID=3040600 RepID=UPI0024471D28|nr:hypothetical protein [Pokkaliibacter sp. MBI-7]MDH2430988.1 hypothetical protein [Pokkaliibacter sp. MBI-7]MDH2436783.1 hypothetical protein [Pokkaliibacter sp. MBI-7]